MLCVCVRACVTQAPDLFRMVDINDDGSIRSGMQREGGGERESESFTILGRVREFHHNWGGRESMNEGGRGGGRRELGREFGREVYREVGVRGRSEM